MDWGSFPSMLFGFFCFFFLESNQLLAVFTLWEQEPCSFSSPVTERQYSSLGLPIILLFSWTELNLPAQRLPRTHWEDDCSPTKPRCQEHSCKSKGRANHSSEVEQGGELPADVLDEETDCGGYVKTQTKKKKANICLINNITLPRLSSSSFHITFLHILHPDPYPSHILYVPVLPLFS